MNTYILLLRGINVGGHRKIKMAALKTLLATLHLEDIKTYIQSGNVVFRSAEKADVLQVAIERSIATHFGFEVKTHIIDLVKLKEIYTQNPFVSRSEDINKLYCTFLFDNPEPDKMETLKAVEAKDDEFIDRDNILYFCYHNGYGKAKIANPFIEQKLKIYATTRNWKTMTKLLEMASG